MLDPRGRVSIRVAEIHADRGHATHRGHEEVLGAAVAAHLVAQTDHVLAPPVIRLEVAERA